MQKNVVELQTYGEWLFNSSQTSYPAVCRGAESRAMSGDLVSLRMLLVAAAPSQRDFWQEAANMASVPIEFAATSAADPGPN